MGNKSVAKIPFIIIILLMSGLVGYLNWPTTTVAEVKPQRAITVAVQIVQQAPFRDVIEAIGTSRANEEVTVFSQHSGVISHVNFDDGQLVEAGQVLITLRHTQEQAQVTELEANLAEAQSQLQRQLDLRSTNATSQARLDEQQAKSQAISAQLAKARAKLSELTVKAAFSGVLGLRQVSPGAYIASNTPIATLDDIQLIKVDFTIPEKELTTVTVGQTIEAKTIAYGQRLFTGQITSIASRLDPVTRSVTVRATIDNKDLSLRPGMLLNILLERDVSSTIMIPETALIPIENQQFVYINDQGKAKRLAVTIGRRRPGAVEVLSGLTEGQQVVVEGTIKLNEGTAIKIKETTKVGSKS